MPLLTSKTLFSGGEAIHPNDLGNAEVLNFTTSIDNRLKDLYKWKGQALGAVGLNLSGDNEKVIGGQFVTRGTTGFKELKFPCNFIWEDSTPEIYLALNIPTLDIFSFDNGGGLWSNIAASASIVHSFHKTTTGEVVLADERSEQGVGNFSARMNCQLSSSSDGRRGIVVKFVILLFPAGADELADAPESKFAGWPGIKLYEGTFPVVPKPTVPWQCPIVPFLRPGVPFSDLATAPSGSRLRAAVSAIMRKCGQPEVLDNGRSVNQRWAEIRSNPRTLLVKQSDTTWPYVETTPEPEGEIKYRSKIYHRICYFCSYIQKRSQSGFRFA